MRAADSWHASEIKTFKLIADEGCQASDMQLEAAGCYEEEALCRLKRFNSITVAFVYLETKSAAASKPKRLGQVLTSYMNWLQSRSQIQAVPASSC
jgi:hypothetical protein